MVEPGDKVKLLTGLSYTHALFVIEHTSDSEKKSAVQNDTPNNNWMLNLYKTTL